jgi:hypothetical protein
MIKLSALYPAGEITKLDMDYYCKRPRAYRLTMGNADLAISRSFGMTTAVAQ